MYGARVCFLNIHTLVQNRDKRKIPCFAALTLSLHVFRSDSIAPVSETTSVEAREGGREGGREREGG